jgi:hypothetical protein
MHSKSSCKSIRMKSLSNSQASHQTMSWERSEVVSVLFNLLYAWPFDTIPTESLRDRPSWFVLCPAL